MIDKKRYKILAYGPGMEGVTWSCASDLEGVKRYLKLEGYTELKIIELEEDGC